MKLRTALGTCASLALLWACANVGNPEGGPFDMTPPRLIEARPGLRATGVKTQRIELRFDEFIKISQQDKIIVSPPQIQQPLITAGGKSVSIKLLDSLRPETTYSLYFDDAIVDNNEDNPIENFAYTFSTGTQIDTMQLGGTVLDAETLEPVSGLVIGAYWAEGLADSVALQQAFPFASKTNKMGRFTMRGLRDSVYRVFALKDNDNNYRYDGQSEGFAFAGDLFRTTKLDSIKTDTIRIDSIVRRDTLWRDSLVTYQHTYYRPDDIVLRYFTPRSKARGLERSNRLDSLRISLEFMEPQTNAPRLVSLDKPEAKPEQLYTPSLSGKSVTYWLRDDALIGADSIRFALTYPRTDSLMQLSQKTDTLTFYKPKNRDNERKAPKLKEGERAPNPFKLVFSGASGVLAGTPSDSLLLTSNFPIEALRREHIRLEMATDSVFAPLDFSLRADSLDGLRYILGFERKYKARYRVAIDSAAVRSIYGHLCDSVGYEQKTEDEGELGRLAVSVQGLDPSGVYIAQLLSKSGEPLMSLPLAHAKGEAGSEATADSTQTEAKVQGLALEFADLKPDTYYLRLFVDSDGDGRWTTGDYPTRQPEMMYYSPMKYEVKKSFTTSETWAPLEKPLSEQKPEELRKQKPEEKKRREDKNKDYYKRMEDKKRK
ncbi:MAG: Ig-like domain-containing protein [Porphyromonas sp.]|nr:Ig-like domain-containing protein [Porphyromonas sp.]